MLQNEFRPLSDPPADPGPARIGDVAAMLRIMRPLNSQLPDPIVGRRRLLADLCRFIGVKVGALPLESIGLTPSGTPAVDPNPADESPKSEPLDIHLALSPRQQQTLQHLLSGDSEKQVARKLGLSQNTIHVHVKALYRRFGVSSRGELLAKHLKRSG
jgi:DNA-binding CsgD family transcriptional regulator